MSLNNTGFIKPILEHARGILINSMFSYACGINSVMADMYVKIEFRLGHSIGYYSKNKRFL